MPYYWRLSFENADFHSIFACGASAITQTQRKSSVIINRKSTTRFPIASKPPEEGSKRKITVFRLKDCIFRRKTAILRFVPSSSGGGA